MRGQAPTAVALVLMLCLSGTRAGDDRPRCKHGGSGDVAQVVWVPAVEGTSCADTCRGQPKPLGPVTGGSRTGLCQETVNTTPFPTTGPGTLRNARTPAQCQYVFSIDMKLKGGGNVTAGYNCGCMPVKEGTNKADFQWSATGKEGGDCPKGYDVAAAVCRFVNPQGKVFIGMADYLYGTRVCYYYKYKGEGLSPVVMAPGDWSYLCGPVLCGDDPRP